VLKFVVTRSKLRANFPIANKMTDGTYFLSRRITKSGDNTASTPKLVPALSLKVVSCARLAFLVSQIWLLREGLLL
jgi:hypothetical protein